MDSMVWVVILMVSMIAQRAPGSIGDSSDAIRVFKGMRMAGRMGTDRVKLKGLKVVKIFPEKNYHINKWFCSGP